MGPLKTHPPIALVRELPEKEMDGELLRAVLPLARSLEDEAGLEALWFHRLVKPDWNLRLAIAAAPEVVAMAAAALGERWRRDDEAEIDPDRAALYHHGSRACLELIACEAGGRSRRELALLLTERLLDDAGVDGERRVRFYELGTRRPFDQGTWTDDDRPLLEERFRSLQGPLAAMVSQPTAALGEEAAGIVERCSVACLPHLERLGPRLDTLQELAERQDNRIGIDGLAAAVLRYFMMRLWQERGA